MTWTPVARARVARTRPVSPNPPGGEGTASPDPGAGATGAEHATTPALRASFVARYVFGCGPRVAFIEDNGRGMVGRVRVGSGGVIRGHLGGLVCAPRSHGHGAHHLPLVVHDERIARSGPCLLYTSDAADERSSVDLGGRRILKKNTSTTITCIAMTIISLLPQTQ